MLPLATNQSLLNFGHLGTGEVFSVKRDQNLQRLMTPVVGIFRMIRLFCCRFVPPSFVPILSALCGRGFFVFTVFCSKLVSFPFLSSLSMFNFCVYVRVYLIFFVLQSQFCPWCYVFLPTATATRLHIRGTPVNTMNPGHRTQMACLFILKLVAPPCVCLSCVFSVWPLTSFVPPSPP